MDSGASARPSSSFLSLNSTASALGGVFTLAQSSLLFPPPPVQRPNVSAFVPPFEQVSTPRDSAADVSCQVCQDSALTRHFGAVCCNACAAFFRRTIAGGRTYLCPKTNSCKIRFDIPKRLCRACRLAKCLHVGMRTEDVQSTHKNSPPLPPPSKTVPVFRLPYIDWIFNYESNKLSSVVDSVYLNDLNSLSTCDLEVVVNWVHRQEKQLAVYLNYFKVFLPPVPLLKETLLGVWCICRLAQSTVAAGSQAKNIFCFDSSTFLPLSEERIRDLLSLSQTTPADRFVLSFVMKSVNGIMDLSKVTASCSLADSDWALITHCAVLAEMLHSGPLHLTQQYAGQLSKLRFELQMHYPKTKHDAVNALIDVLLSLRTTMANSIQALKLCGRKDIFDAVLEKSSLLTYF